MVSFEPNLEPPSATSPLLRQDLELFFAVAPNLLCVLDREGCFQRVNVQFLKILGYDMAPLLGQPFLDFVHPEDRRGSQQSLESLREKGGTVSFENRYRCINGGYRDLVWHGIAPAQTSVPDQTAQSGADDQGNLTGLIYATATDITAQKQAEHALSQERDFSKAVLDTINVLNVNKQKEIALHYSQQTLASIFDLAGEAIICIDQRQHIRLFNQTAERIFGYGAAEVVGRSLDLLLPEALQAIHRQHVEQFGRSSVTSRHMGQRPGQVSGRRKNGEIFPAAASISKSTTKDGLWYTVMLQDVTERIQAETAIRRSEAQLRTTTNALPVLIAYIDADERYQFNNRAYEEWLGVPYETLKGQSLEQALGPDIYHTIQPYLHQALKGETVTFEVEFPSGVLPYRWVSVSYLPDIQEGQVRGCFALTQDISDRKATDQIKHEFVSVVSHELRTPLTSIHGALKLITTGQLGHLNPQGQELLEIALNNTKRLTRLVNDVLDLERIESGRVKMIKVRCQVAQVLHQAAQAMMSMAQSEGVTIKVVPVDTHIYADPDHVEQTLTNLLSNAIKFSPRGETVVLKAVDQPHQVLFKVIDHGRGIPEDKLETIFERFQQVDASDTRKHGGTGLGLAICREIVQRHEGRIWVRSTHGQGSTFCFTLPKTPSHDEP
ncbi:PAS domain-containing sensor histidine kinase [Leptothoe sp. PORK10 BA2]|uniref:PAS domain-containing sensor histidine kinase n=1 Tax=Leptothoe sp. PORK10 BA2 TaxID=3110254 RepID=UPI002B1E9341|nr:PAS domain S-box protein [Leptothoe sp. PORK10 BA2]MEA5465815.1 PAS domain S-box protein [Leptothoe sp. PORK10 BA2]